MKRWKNAGAEWQVYRMQRTPEECCSTSWAENHAEPLRGSGSISELKLKETPWDTLKRRLSSSWKKKSSHFMVCISPASTTIWFRQDVQDELGIRIEHQECDKPAESVWCLTACSNRAAAGGKMTWTTWTRWACAHCCWMQRLPPTGYYKRGKRRRGRMRKAWTGDTILNKKII